MNVVLKNLVIKVITEYFQNLNFCFIFKCDGFNLTIIL